MLKPGLDFVRSILVGVVLLVEGDDAGDDLGLVGVALGEEGPAGAVDHAAGERLLLGGAPFPAEVAARDATRGEQLLLVVDREGEEVDALLLLLGRDHLGQDVVHFLLGERRGLLAGADEAGDLGRALDQVPGLVGHPHLDQDVAGEELALGLALLAGLVLDHGLHRDADLADRLAHAEGVGALAQRLLDPLLEAGVGVDDVPAALPFRRRGHVPTTLKSWTMTMSASQR